MQDYGRHYGLPLAAVFLLLLLAALFLSHRNYLGLARERDLARVQRYVDLSKAIFEARLPATKTEDILKELRNSGLDTVELLPLDQKPTYRSPSFGTSPLNAEAWTTVHDPAGNPVGVLKIARVDDSAVLALRFIRISFIGAVVIFAILLVAGWLVFRRRIVGRAVEMGHFLQSVGAPAAQESVNPMDFLQSSIATYVGKHEEQAKLRQALLDGHSEVACIGTLEGVLLEVNAAYCRLFGKKREELVGTNYVDLIPPADRGDALTSLRRLSRRHPVNTVEHRVVLPDGGMRWLRWRDQAVFDEQDNVVEVLSFGTDITSQKELESRLEGLQLAFDQMQSLARTGSLTWNFKKDRMQWTDETFRLLGLEHENTEPSLGRLLESVLAEDREPLRQVFQRARESGDPFEREFRALLPDGSVRVLQSRAEVTADPKTKLLDLLTCTLRDITALRDAEAATKRELRFREAIEQSMGVGVVVSDNNGRNLMVNPAFCEMTGWSQEELVGIAAPYPYWPEEEIPAINNAFQLAIAGKTPAAGFELNFCRKNGERFDVLVKVAPLLDSDDKQLGWLGAVADISSLQNARRELAAAEKELRQELNYREAIEKSTSVGLVAIGADGCPMSANETYCRMLGYGEEEVLAWKPPYPCWPEDEHNNVQRAFDLHLQGKTPPEGFQIRLRKKNGTLFDVVITVSPIRDIDGKQTGLLSALTDVTALQGARRELLASNERLRIAQDVIEFGIWDWDPVTDTLFWDRNSFAIFGQPDATDAREVWKVVHSEEDQERLTYELRRLIAAGGASGQDRICARWPDGSIHEILSTYIIIRDTQGRAVRVLGVNRDVTPELEEERELRSAQERLAAALEGGKFGTFEHVFGVGAINWNTANYELHGIDPRITDPDELFHAWKAVVGPEYAALEQKISGLPSSKNVITYNFAITVPGTGENRRINSSVFVERNKQGHPIRLVGISRRLD